MFTSGHHRQVTLTVFLFTVRDLARPGFLSKHTSPIQFTVYNGLVKNTEPPEGCCHFAGKTEKIVWETNRRCCWRWPCVATLTMITPTTTHTSGRRTPWWNRLATLYKVSELSVARITLLRTGASPFYLGEGDVVAWWGGSVPFWERDAASLYYHRSPGVPSHVR